MTQNKKHIQELHEEIKIWRSDVALIKIETVTLNNQLEAVAAENSKDEVLAKIEHFQNIFIRQAEVNDELMHDINAAEHHLVHLVSENTTASDHRLVDDNPVLRDKVETNNKLFAEIRHDFNRFAADWL